MKSETVDLSIIGMGAQVIHVCIVCFRTKNVFRDSFVYGFNTFLKVRSLWDDLKIFGDACILTWILLGDFNIVMSPDEKKGRLKVKNYDIQDFVDCIGHIDLLSLRFFGCFIHG